METMMPQDSLSPQELRRSKRAAKEATTHISKMPPAYYRGLGYRRFDSRQANMYSTIIEDNKGGLWMA